MCAIFQFPLTPQSPDRDHHFERKMDELRRGPCAGPVVGTLPPGDRRPETSADTSNHRSIVNQRDFFRPDGLRL